MTAKTTQIFTQINDAIAELMRHDRSELVECRTRAGRTIFAVIAPADDPVDDNEEIRKLWDYPLDDDEIVGPVWMRSRFRRA